MTDGIERKLRELDADRPLPEALYSRLEAALLADAAVRAGGTDDAAAALFDALDAPRPIPPATRAALERELVGVDRRSRRRSRMLLGVAAAILLVVGTVAALRPGGSSSNRHLAVGPARTVPEAGVPPVLQTPTTTSAPLPVIVGAKPTSPPTTRRSTPPTTWDCGLCARNGAKGSAGAAASPSTTGGTWQPSGGPVAAAATASMSPKISTVDPSSGRRRGGTIVTLTGYGFTGASGVMFGSTAAANFTVVSDTEIRVMAPPSPGRERVGVSVVYPDGTTTATNGDSPPFTYT
jgi:hypothetical protein